MKRYEQAEFFGIKNRLAKLSEECGELIQALMKYYESLDIKSDEDEDYYIDKIEEEMADVYLLSSEVRYLLNIHGHDLEDRIDFKIKRTDKLIKELMDKKIDTYISKQSIIDIVDSMKKGLVEEGVKTLDLFLELLGDKI